MMICRKQHIVLGIIAAGIIVGFVFLRYLPLKRQIESARRAGSEQLSLISRAESEQMVLVSLQEQLEGYQKIAKRYQEQIPREPDLGSFLHKISSLMNNYGLGNQLIKPGESVLVSAGGGDKSFMLYGIPIDMKCDGRLEQLFDFYRSLEKCDRLIRIEHVTIENDREFEGGLSMNTKAFIYYMKEDVEKADKS